ncbi:MULTISPECIES: TIGR04076 family protein [Gordonia]|uniref:TIGR04076 family protein n=1 Tax=Gordonia rubripertincta TaxID=36822 RepID=A0AAW4G241_GORRU|nr:MULTISPECIES: TIGR04076 family protein [Gordonia]MBM7277463.1 TIGR04076 family protein [Gordonia rubripertincta]MCK8615955.1 TIGR04076 family protein [Gordonia sp. C13]
MSVTVRCTVESMNYSACGLEVGDHFDLSATGVVVPEGKKFCYFAIANVLPVVLGRLDGAGADDYLSSSPLLACPDAPEAVRMRVRVLDESATPTIERTAG